MKSRMRVCWAILSLASMSGCAGSADDTPVGESSSGIILDTQLTPVQAGGTNLAAKYRPLINGFGRLNNGGFCTATHVGNGIAISAGHCFSAGATRQDHTSCSGAFVQWGYIAGSTPTRSDCVEVLAKEQNGARDYAIFRVSPVPSVTVPVNLTQAAANGTTITIFSHPGARRLEWSQTCNSIQRNSTQFSYRCSTEGGSSGASVLRDDTLAVTGIHWGTPDGTTRNSATDLVATPLAEFLGGGGGGDTTAPVIGTIALGRTTAPTSGQNSIQITVTDNSSVADVILNWTFNGKVIKASAPNATSGWTVTKSGNVYTFSANFGTGARAFTVQAVDGAGNAATKSGSFTFN